MSLVNAVFGKTEVPVQARKICSVFRSLINSSFFQLGFRSSQAAGVGSSHAN